MANDVVGIDVSHWQEAILWDKVKTQVHYAYIKATESKTYYDPRFAENWQESKDAGIVRGAYHFLRAHSDVQSAKKQADNFYNTLSKTGDFGELMPILDVERNDDGLSKYELQNAIWKFIQRFEGLSGRQLGIYTSKGFWDGNVASYPGNTDIPRDRLLWTANYRNDPPPAIPFDWDKRYGPNCWTFWQWTPKGKVDGIAKHVDLNKYNGNLAAFNKQFKVNVKPLPDIPIEPPDPPAEMPEVVKITGLQGTDNLNMRSDIWGPIVAKTWNGSTFEVMDQEMDSQDRIWYQVGSSIWIASWYTEVVE